MTERVIGTYDTGQQGPVLVGSGALHGNEPAGAFALERVFALLEKARPLGRGGLIGLLGNRAALAAGRRFLVRDLNRGWSTARAEALLRLSEDEPQAEDREERDLLRAILQIRMGARGPLTFLDLHSTSGGGAPFVCMANSQRNRQVGFSLHLPVILGLEEIIDGTMLRYLHELGHTALSVEGGQHDDPATVAHQEAVIWLTLFSMGVFSQEELGSLVDLEEKRRLLQGAGAGLPRAVAICHRHVIRPGDAFCMGPGFHSFQRVEQGQLLAHDRHGEIRAPLSGRLLMPLYQPQGEDGFFLAEEVEAGV